MVNKNIEIRILAHEKGVYKSYALEESKSRGIKGDKPKNPELKDVQLDDYC